MSEHARRGYSQERCEGAEMQGCQTPKSCKFGKETVFFGQISHFLGEEITRVRLIRHRLLKLESKRAWCNILLNLHHQAELKIQNYVENIFLIFAYVLQMFTEIPP